MIAAEGFRMPFSGIIDDVFNRLRRDVMYR